MWKQFFKMCVCNVESHFSSPSDQGSSLWLQRVRSARGRDFVPVGKTAFRGIFQDGNLSKCITKLYQSAALILYMLTESHVWLEVRLNLLQFVPVRNWSDYYVLLYYCRAYVLTRSQKSVCPQKLQYIIPVLFKLRPAGPFRRARHFKSGPWRHLNRMYSTYYIRSHVVRSAVIFHKIPELMSNYKFIHSLVFGLRGRVGRNQIPVMWPVWLWHTASWASSWG